MLDSVFRPFVIALEFGHTAVYDPKVKYFQILMAILGSFEKIFQNVDFDCMGSSLRIQELQ